MVQSKQRQKEQSKKTMETVRCSFQFGVDGGIFDFLALFFILERPQFIQSKIAVKL